MTWVSLVLDEIAKHWVEALINFSATFSGIAASFAVEHWRSRKREKEEFGKVLATVLYESSNNHGLLNNIRNTYRVGATSGFDLNTDVLGLALTNPVFHKWASQSLILAANSVKNNLTVLNNILALHRQAQATGRGASEYGVEEVKSRAKTAVELILVMQRLLNDAIVEMNVRIRRDDQSEETIKRLAMIFREEDEAIKNLSTQASRGNEPTKSE
jgi:hypothetical protein